MPRGGGGSRALTASSFRGAEVQRRLFGQRPARGLGRHTSDMPHLPELPATPQTTFYSAEMLALGLERFEREGLWLLLSLHHYGWRAHADMAAFLVSDADPLDLGEHHLEHRAMAGLEELFLLLDQLWRLIAGIRSHRAATVSSPATGATAATSPRSSPRCSK